jgi:hypothetical protein
MAKKSKPAPAKAPKKAAAPPPATKPKPAASPVGQLLSERRPVGQMPAHLAQAIVNNPPRIDGDKLLELKTMVSAARDLEKEREMLAERLSEINSDLDGPEGYYFRKMPALMTEIGLTSITIEPDGNLPGYVATASPYYKASISAEWPEEKRKEAFDYLEEIDAGDLIKTEVTVAFPREQRALALKFQKIAKQYGDATIKENVAWNTLTAWLREQVEEVGEIPQLDKIGGIVARIVKLKEKKD